jgi:hypothetical protein
VLLNFELLPGVLRMQVRQRETVDETRELIDAMFAEREKHGVLAILVVVSDSRPIFKVDGYGLNEVLERVKAIPGLRIAGVTDDPGLRASQEYVTLLAQQRGAEMRRFATEDEALAWLREDR